MSKKNCGLPWFPIWADDLLALLAHTQEPPEVTGARLRLWCIACREDPVGTLPDDIDRLTHWAGLSGDAGRRIIGEIANGWEHDENCSRFRICRIVEEAKKRRKIIAKRSASAKARWAEDQAAADDKPYANAYANAEQNTGTAKMQMQCSPSPSPSPSFKSNSPNGLSSETAGQAAIKYPTEADIAEVYRHYLATWGDTEHSYRLTKKRRDKIRCRLREWEPSDGVKALKRVIDASAADDWTERPKHRDIADHLFHSEEKVEWWLRRAKAGGRDALR